MGVATQQIVKNLENKRVDLLPKFEMEDDAFFNSGEFYFKLLRNGFKLIEVTDITYKNPLTIERRVIEYLATDSATEDDARFFSENVKGLKYIGDFQRYCNSELKLRDFLNREHIAREGFNKILKKIIAIPFFKKTYERKEEKLRKKESQSVVQPSGFKIISKGNQIKRARNIDRIW